MLYLSPEYKKNFRPFIGALNKGEVSMRPFNPHMAKQRIRCSRTCVITWAGRSFTEPSS